MPHAPIEITTDELWPRDEEHRYRLYLLRGEGEDEQLDTIAAGPTMGSLGCAIGQIDDDLKEVGKRLRDAGTIGILDVLATPTTGDWIVLPWQRSSEPVTFGRKPRRIKEKT